MPKMKSKRSAAKRLAFTGSGKVKYKKMNLRHILTKKSAKTQTPFAQRRNIERCRFGKDPQAAFTLRLNYN